MTGRKGCIDVKSQAWCWVCDAPASKYTSDPAWLQEQIEVHLSSPEHKKAADRLVDGVLSYSRLDRSGLR